MTLFCASQKTTNNFWGWCTRDSYQTSARCRLLPSKVNSSTQLTQRQIFNIVDEVTQLIPSLRTSLRQERSRWFKKIIIQTRYHRCQSEEKANIHQSPKRFASMQTWNKKCWLWTMTHLETCFKHCSTRMKALTNPLNESPIHFKSNVNPKLEVDMVNERLANDKLSKHPTKRLLTIRLYKLSWTMFRPTRSSNHSRIDFSRDETLEMRVYSQTQCPSKCS